MCGIVGLLLKDSALRPRLGELMVPMLIGMTERGPDSCGIAIFTDDPDTGPRMKVYKDVGLPSEVAARYEFAKMQGTHLIGHTRMATESVITPENAHPYTAGEDWCLVHNGSLANPGSLRRRLERQGEQFRSDCDTEVACRYLHGRLKAGDSLQQALTSAFEDFDGFFTFLMGTGTALALVRDPLACKPAVVAETDEYVAAASEFRSLAHLPGIDHAHVFEPKPGEVYSWSVS